MTSKLDRESRAIIETAKAALSFINSCRQKSLLIVSEKSNTVRVEFDGIHRWTLLSPLSEQSIQTAHFFGSGLRNLQLCKRAINEAKDSDGISTGLGAAMIGSIQEMPSAPLIKGLSFAAYAMGAFKHSICNPDAFALQGSEAAEVRYVEQMHLLEHLEDWLSTLQNLAIECVLSAVRKGAAKAA